ncbi:hypothetical protein BY996DRAFT_6514230 [Phakopsora pachyrhizi]|nr:hypothetical protein BY996DRAFT_6514230 [Phakopsora pachyrhizi]
MPLGGLSVSSQLCNRSVEDEFDLGTCRFTELIRGEVDGMSAEGLMKESLRFTWPALDSGGVPGREELRGWLRVSGDDDEGGGEVGTVGTITPSEPSLEASVIISILQWTLEAKDTHRSEY